MERFGKLPASEITPEPVYPSPFESVVGWRVAQPGVA
jgi:hypothetical protein